MVDLFINEPFFRFLDAHMKSEKIIAVLQGGSGSGKTYSILQYLISCCHDNWQNETIDIVRDTMPFLRISVMKDFFDILKSIGKYDISNHDQSHNTYKLGTNTFRFYSADDKEKAKGARRSILYLNEALSIKRNVAEQLMMRTSKKIFIDYNPSEEFSWIYDEIIPDKRTSFMKSTFLDNRFIPAASKLHILSYKEKDPNLWRIYGLGERGVSLTTIFFNWEQSDLTWENCEGEELFGMDFGYMDPTVLLRVKYHEKLTFAEELLYKTELTSDGIIRALNELREKGKIKYTSKIIADSSRPELIEAIARAGYNIHRAKKGEESVLRGINFIKLQNLKISKDSVNFIKEMRGYKWKVNKDEKVLDEPVDINNHAIDALRYALEDKSRNRKKMGLGQI